MKHSSSIVFFVATVSLAAAGAWSCKSEQHAPPPPAPTNISDQIALGGKAFGAHCARCHGDAGQGGKKAPPLVGPNALPLDPRPGQKVRTVQFHTALDVAQFAVKNMPPDEDDREEVSATEYWAIIAFDLSANGIQPKAVVGPDNAAMYRLH